MNEIKKIHLGRQQFTIAIGAYKELHEYLEAIEKQPGVQAEVTKEVEARMAELLTERGVTPDKVVLSEDVAFLKEQLGEPHDFKDEEEDADKEAESSAEVPKRLYRDTDTALIAGVGSGLAAYLGIDAVIVRLIFVLLTFASGAGIILYILLWLIVPEAKTTSERLQMRGKAVTVDSLKNLIDRADIAGASERAGQSLGRLVSQVINGVFKGILTIIGVGFTIVGSSLMLWTIATTVYLFIHGGQIGNEIFFPTGFKENWFVVLTMTTAVIAGFFLLMIGLTMITRKWRLPGWSVAALLGIFLLTASVGTALGFDTIPNLRDRIVKAHHTSSLTTDAFTSVTLNGKETRFSFKPDNNYKVEFRYFGKMDTTLFKTKVENGVLMIDTSEFMKQPLCSGICLYSDHDMTVTVHAPSLDKVKLNGQLNTFNIDQQLNQQNLSLEVNRNQDVDMHLNYMAAATVAVNDDADNSTRTVQLTGIKPNAAEDNEMEFGRLVNVWHADHFTYTAQNRCDEYMPQMQLLSAPADVTINGETIAGTGYNAKRSPDQQSVYNCVVVR